jgi:hypothetical protein
MAKIKLGAMAQDVRGKLGGTVYSRNRGGAYVRCKVSPVQPITPYNTLSRDLFKAVSQHWSQVLTDGQRAGYEAFAAVHAFVDVFGDSIILSGVAFFQATNKRNRQVGEDYIDDAPPGWNVDDLGSVAPVITAAGGIITEASLTPTRTLYAPEGLYVFATPPILGARTPQRNNYRLINTQDSGLYASGFDFKDDLNARFGSQPWAAGDKVAILVAALNPDIGNISHAIALEVTVA